MTTRGARIAEDAVVVFGGVISGTHSALPLFPAGLGVMAESKAPIALRAGCEVLIGTDGGEDACDEDTPV